MLDTLELALAGAERARAEVERRRPELLERAKPIFFAGRFADAEAEKLAEDGIAVLCYSGGALRENAAASRLLERTA